VLAAVPRAEPAAVCGAAGSALRLLIWIPASSRRKEDDACASGAGVSDGGFCRTQGSLLEMSPLSLEIKPSLLVEAFISSLMTMQQPQAELKSWAHVSLPNGRT